MAPDDDNVAMLPQGIPGGGMVLESAARGTAELAEGELLGGPLQELRPVGDIFGQVTDLCREAAPFSLPHLHLHATESLAPFAGAPYGPTRDALYPGVPVHCSNLGPVGVSPSAAC